MLKNELLSLISREMPGLRRKYHVRKLGIFGSVARGEDSAVSDVDILVEFEQPVGFFDFVRLEEFLSQVLGRKVDLVTRRALKEPIAEEILAETAYV